VPIRVLPDQRLRRRATVDHLFDTQRAVSSRLICFSLTFPPGPIPAREDRAHVFDAGRQADAALPVLRSQLTRPRSSILVINRDRAASTAAALANSFHSTSLT